MSRQTPKIPSSFSNAATPLRVVIEKQGNHYHEDIHADDKNEMLMRLGDHDTHYKNHWNNRNGKHGAPRYARGGGAHPNHLPVTALADDFVQFRCIAPFMAVLPADPEVDLASGAPKNPVDGANPAQPFFGVSTFDNALNLWVVNVKVSSGAGAQNQIFYKMFFIVQDEDGAHFVDPDFDTP